MTKQRGQVIGGMPDEGVLKIEQTDAGDALAFRQPMQVLAVIVAQDDDLRIMGKGC